MIVPALLYAAVNLGSESVRGWGIPMATDIAFAMAILAVLGTRLPSGLRLFLLTLAIVDDIGAVLVIALFYTEVLAPLWLMGAVGVVVVVLIMRRLRVTHPLAYLLPAIALWVCFFESGVHATMAGVILGFLTPARPPFSAATIERLEALLHPWSSFVVVPLFALANAGVRLSGPALERAATGSVAWGIMIGLVIGKPLGIVGATALSLRSRRARLPAGVEFRHVVGAGMLAGIGFTVALFIAGLSFSGLELEEAKLAIFTASVLSGILGSVVLLLVGNTVRARRGKEA
jgi:NhaA family Na+:H+ antiporter